MVTEAEFQEHDPATDAPLVPMNLAPEPEGYSEPEDAGEGGDAEEVVADQSGDPIGGADGE